jgi:hypothetical protein
MEIKDEYTYTTINYDVIQGNDKIIKCINSCISNVQLDSVERMINNFNNIYKCDDISILYLFRLVYSKRKKLKTY